MALLFAAFEFCLLLQQARQEVAFVAEQAGVVLQLDRTEGFRQELAEKLFVETFVKSVEHQVRDEVEKEVLSGLEGLIEKIIEEEMAGKERPVFTPPDVRSSVEILILPDGRARCRSVMDVFGDDAPSWYAEFRKDWDEVGIADNETPDRFVEPDQLVEVDKSTGDITQMKLELHDHHMRFTTIMYYDSVNGAEVFAVGKVKFAKTTDGFEIKVANSFADALREFSVGDQASLTLILPGDVLDMPPGSTVKSRGVTWGFDEKTWTAEQTKIFRQKPRAIRCGPSLIDDRELADFAKERNEVLAKKAPDRPPSPVK